MAQAEGRLPVGGRLPWCTLFLVVSLTASNLCVWLGNRAVAKAIGDVGESARGWSRVVQGMTQSLEEGVIVKMLQVSDSLAQGFEYLSPVQTRLQATVALAGQLAELVGSQTQAPPSVLELQAEALPETVVAAKQQVLHAVRETLAKERGEIAVQLRRLHERLQPAFRALGRWAQGLGSDVQSGLSNFAATVDQVQGLLDQVLSQLRRRRIQGKEETLLAEVFDFFDTNHDGRIRQEELQSAAERYAIPELQGSLGAHLAAAHGSPSAQDGHTLEPRQLGELLADPALPLSAGQVLQRYARQLMDISSQLTTAATEPEVATALVRYLSVISTKNATKVLWIAERLGNESLPLEFTASVLVQLCEHDEDPERLDNGAGVGAWVLGALNRQYPDVARRALALVSNISFWTSAGLEAADEPVCQEKLRHWLGPDFLPKQEPMPAAAALPGTAADQSAPAASAETHQFALWLSFNTSATAQTYQDLVFDCSTSSSSGASHSDGSRADGLGTQLQGLLGQLEGLVGLMAEYASPAAMSQLEQQLLGDANRSVEKLSLLVEKRLQHLLDAAGPHVQRLVAAIERASGLLGEAVGGECKARLEQLLQSAIKSLANTSDGGDAVSLGLLRQQEGVGTGRNAGEGASALLQTENLRLETPVPAHARGLASEEVLLEALGLLDNLPEALRLLADKLPLALTSLAAARRETAKLRTVLSAAFAVFEARGPAIFDTASTAWSTVWALYFLLLLPVHVLVLCYSFWAQGLGLSKPQGQGQAEEQGRDCCSCSHTALCLWPALLGLQAVTALLFLAAVLLCAALGLEAFVQQGCSQVYPLVDETSCEEALRSLEGFVHIFSAVLSEVEVEVVEAEVVKGRCGGQALLTCQLMGRMMSATVLTVCFSFVSAILSAQMLVDFAIHHERARFLQRTKEECRGEAATND